MAYDWKITLKKFGVSLAFVLIAGLISTWQQDPLYMGLVPLLEALRNFLKNYDSI